MKSLFRHKFKKNQPDRAAFFGNPFGWADKFGRLEDYYRYIVPEKGADYYRTVNLKFEKQIVCRK